MREIKFRAWNGKIMTIEFSLWSDGSVASRIGGFHKELSPLIIMQYTGLKDKNGKEIYEGDIVLWSSWNIGAKSIDGKEHAKYKREVRWDVIRGEWTIELRNDKYANYPLGIYDNVEIIGNIYENPSGLIGGVE